nr:integrase, catalytic region, zinc finger, CCHC-type, peptidase aspartic, catalytic [Tanacetum cinerariifolium]
HYKQLYDSIKITRAKHIEQVTKLTAKNVMLKTSVSKAKVQPSVPMRTKHAVDVELIVPRLRNNRDAHLDYLRHLKESVETIRDIVEEAKVTVRFGNDHFGAIMGYGDYVVGESVISRVYYVEGLGHNLFSVGQFCDSDLKVAFRKHSCYVWDTDGVDLIKGSRGSNLYTISVEDMMNIFHQKTVPRTPQQNGVVERQNRTLVEAAQTMLIFSKASMFLWAEAVATAEDLGKLQPTAGIFVGYAPSGKGYRIYNKRTRRIMETIHVQLDELTEPMAPVHLKLEILFQPMFDEYLEPPRAERPGSPAQAVQTSVNFAGVVAEPHFMEDHNVTFVDNNPIVNVFALEPHSEASSSGDISSTESPYVSQSLHHLNK